MGRHGWGSGRRRRRIIALLGATAVALALVLYVSLADNGGGKAVRAGPANPSLGWGLTHTQYSVGEGDPADLRAARKALSARPLPQNQHIMGWGADNPEPSPGRYDFTALDRRVELIEETGGTPILTLCCAPDWMKGGIAGRTDWSPRSLETAPSPDHYDDFARLAATVAERYPDVRHFIVWNEFKGFFDESKKRWNYEGYTDLYNRVYRALKKVNKENLVGGPYLVMDSFAPGRTEHGSALKGPWGSIDQRGLDAFDYWNAHKAGADFVVVDGSSYTRAGETLPDEFRATDKFTAVGRWLRERTRLPLWWAEYYVESEDETGTRDRWSEPHRRAVHAAAMIAMARGGADTVFYWTPQNRGDRCTDCLWSSTGVGGVTVSLLDLVRRFNTEFAPGTMYRPVDVSPGAVPDVRVLADDDALLVVNTLDRPLRTNIDGRTVDLDGHEVLWTD
jgi:hypothetical protein